ncbi:hypothetical protein BST65_06080 [Bradyrhizobium canariense]|uniref:hypothetical protein n=1 Tax=Bradyrhizobium sp. WU425 TaxID=187029 RepID=UPI000A190897|nr:hypothetical protein [Bradyrhizobium canariense]OSI30838.1 hypothetical protein BST65_06080 [Bradyrhizobium canariense]OSI35167.1 hypothetical protein BST66_09010 [Bradyrhizobium canariense]OSI47177.1 hypothetical protein BSZ20_09380 [Bradyrhizobium canariense]OSI54296.1 hypothetical protein BST67_07100 [Bradyrhizobium canariense]OSI57893.1 hypothetical protein BSZ15_11530 [Bradyrhizobium canariense]
MPFQKSRRCDDGHVGAGVNFHVTVLKILVSYPDGFAAMEDLKRDMAILATSGRDWTERTRRLAGRVPGLDIFSQGLIDRTNGGWRITAKGRAVLGLMEARPDQAPIATQQPPSEPELGPAVSRHIPAERIRGRLAARRRRRNARMQARAS